MEFVTFYDGTSYVHVEVTEEFAREYVEMEHRDKLIERKETRRHQSLNKSMEHGWDIADPRIDIPFLIEQKELRGLIREAMKNLTEKQRIIFRLYFWEELNFREIGELLGLHEDTPRKHYIAAIKKLQKFFQNYSENHDFRGF